jgi:cellulose synthase/poly-beta-1,6-N-acetylglucosamine synthase-like glycosyltransferase
MTISIIIPYKIDRGWLMDAVNSVPKEVQLLLSQGEGNWPENFNKAFSKATGDLIKFLHEDDMLTANSIESYIKAFSLPIFKDIDFAHGNAYEIFMNEARPSHLYIPKIKFPTVSDLLMKNTIHSASLIYRREVFEKVGLFDKTLNTAEEFEFNLRCLKAGLKIGYINVPLAYYRRHPAQKVRMVSKDKKDAEREMVKDKYR